MNTRHLVDPELRTLLDLWPTITVDRAALPLLRDPNRLPLPPISNPDRVEKRVVAAPGRDGAPNVR